MTSSKEDKSGLNQAASWFKELSGYLLRIGLPSYQILIVLTVLLSYGVPVARAEDSQNKTGSATQPTELQTGALRSLAELNHAALEALLHTLELQQQTEYGPPQNLPEPFGSAPPDELSMTALGEALGLAIIQPTEEPDGSVTQSIVTALSSPNDPTEILDQITRPLPAEIRDLEKVRSLDAWLLPNNSVLICALVGSGADTKDRCWIIDVDGKITAELEINNMFGEPVVIDQGGSGDDAIVFAENINSDGEFTQHVSLYSLDLKTQTKIWESYAPDPTEPNQKYVLNSQPKISNGSIVIEAKLSNSIVSPLYIFVLQHGPDGWQTTGPIELNNSREVRQVVGNNNGPEAGLEPTVVAALGYKVSVGATSLEVISVADDGTVKRARIENVAILETALTALPSASSSTQPELLGVHIVESNGDPGSASVVVIFQIVRDDGSTTLHSLKLGIAALQESDSPDPVQTGQYEVMEIAELSGGLTPSGTAQGDPQAQPTIFATLEINPGVFARFAFVPKEDLLRYQLYLTQVAN